MRKIVAVAFVFSSLLGCSTIPAKDDSAGWKEKLYHRLPCEMRDGNRVIELFYATDRRVIQEDNDLRFTSRIDDRLTTGTVKAGIRPGLEIARVVPKKIKRRGDVGIEEVTRIDGEDFIKRLGDAVDRSPHKSLLVLVFGYKDNFELTAVKAAYFAYLLDVNTPILIFDWPGDCRGPVRGYGKAWVSATDSGKYLGRLLTDIIRKIKPEKLWLESSSLGCQVVCHAFEEMALNSDLADAEAELTHVVMAAPDVSKNEFNETFKEEIASLTRQLTVYVASNDKALLMAQIIDREKKLGRQRGMRIESYDQFEEARDLLYLKSLDPDRISIVDMTWVNKAGSGHTYYIETPEFYDDFYMRLFSDSAPYNRHLYLVNVKEDIDYWVIRSDRK